jgi:hypothetical protein
MFLSKASSGDFFQKLLLAADFPLSKLGLLTSGQTIMSSSKKPDQGPDETRQK